MSYQKAARAAPAIAGSDPRINERLDGGSSSVSTTSPHDAEAANRTRLRFLAARLHALGHKPMFHFLDELVRGAELRLDFLSWGSPADILYGAAHSYQENLWLDQLRRPEVWIEKAALIGVMKPACEKWRVPHMAARDSELYSAGKRLQGHLEDGLAPVVFYLGDHDPSGLDMTRSLREELSLDARAPIEVVRLGLNLDQVRELRLPSNPAKETDRRFEQYVRETGCTDSWELDALSPAFIDGLIEQAISDLVDHEAWKEALGREQANNDLLLRTATSFAETVDGP